MKKESEDEDVECTDEVEEVDICREVDNVGVEIVGNCVGKGVKEEDNDGVKFNADFICEKVEEDEIFRRE